MDEFSVAEGSAYDFEIVINRSHPEYLEHFLQEIRHKFSILVEKKDATKKAARENLDMALQEMGLTGGVEQLVRHQLETKYYSQELQDESPTVEDILSDPDGQERILEIFLDQIDHRFDEVTRILRYQRFVIEKLLPRKSVSIRQLLAEMSDIEEDAFDSVTAISAIVSTLLRNAGLR